MFSALDREGRVQWDRGEAAQWTKEKSFNCAEGFGERSLWKDVEGGLLSTRKPEQLSDRRRRGAYSDCFCCKPKTTGMRSYVVWMRQAGMVGIRTVGPFVESASQL